SRRSESGLRAGDNGVPGSSGSLVIRRSIRRDRCLLRAQFLSQIRHRPFRQNPIGAIDIRNRRVNNLRDRGEGLRTGLSNGTRRMVIRRRNIGTKLGVPLSGKEAHPRAREEKEGFLFPAIARVVHYYSGTDEEMENSTMPGMAASTARDRRRLLRLQSQALQYFLDNQTPAGLILDPPRNHGPLRTIGPCSPTATGITPLPLAPPP